MSGPPLLMERASILSDVFFPDRQMLISPLPISSSISHVKRQGEKKVIAKSDPRRISGQWIKTCIVKKKKSRAFQLDRRIEMLHEHCSEFPFLFLRVRVLFEAIVLVFLQWSRFLVTVSELEIVRG